MTKTISSTANGQHNGKKANNESSAEDSVAPRYVVLIPKRFVILSVLSCILVAFAVGRTARMLLLVNPQNRLLQISSDDTIKRKQQNKDPTSRTSSAMKSLPDPRMPDGKFPPETLYTSKSFGTGSRVSSSQSRWIVTEAGKENCVDLPESECPASSSFDTVDNNSSSSSSTDDAIAIHLPAGQHILLDIENVDGNFLNSEERLAHAMLELVSECGLTLLSYHCHKMVPMGVSCAGVLLESHVSFHTWPHQGVITLDLFTCGPDSLLPMVPLATKLFAVPKEVDIEGETEVKEPNVVWAHKTRGFPEGEHLVAEMSDMEYFPVGRMTDYKNEVSYVPYHVASYCISSH